ncbi:unnamed protein product, partial [Effrenium voratum]
MAERSEALGPLFVGTAGFSCPHWTQFFGKGDLLVLYQETFWAVEVNSSFYGVPSLETVQTWRRKCAEGFRLGLKAPRTVTHENLGGETSLESLRFFLQRVAPLAQHLGPILFQCPRSLKADCEMLRRVAKVLDEQDLSIQAAFEFRDASWLSHEALDFLKSRNWALVQHPNTLGRATSAEKELETYPLEPLQEDLVTADWVYVRLHGNNDGHTYRYTDEELLSYARQLHGWRQRGLKVFAFLLNDDAGAAMPQNARRLWELCCGLAAEGEVRGPKLAKQRSLRSFFGAPKKPRREEG